ncbi:MAG TPA: extracellular solute-binding protein [Bacilli bacterium]
MFKLLKKKTALCGLILLFALATALTACGGTGSKATDGAREKPDNTAGSNAAQPTKVTIMSHFFGAAPPDANGEVQKKIEEATNTELDIQWVSANSYNDKLNVTLASGNIPDLITIDDPFSPVFRNAVEHGAFWDITPYYKDYPNLISGISETAWELTKMQDGKNYGIPRPRPSEGDAFFVVRKDWLDQAGLKIPTTSDELYEAMKAFKATGKDHIGFTGYFNAADMGSFGPFEGIFTGANGFWKANGDQLEFTAFLPEEKEALQYLANAYNDGLLPADVASLQLSQMKDIYKSGKAGMIVDKTGTAKDYYSVMEQNDPNLNKLDAFYPITSINNYNPKGPGFAGISAIPKSVPEDKMKKILAMVNTWMNPEVFAYQKWGIEGRDYKVENGVKVQIADNYQKDALGEYNQIVYVSDQYASTSKDYFPEDMQKLYKQVQDDRANSSVADVSIGLYSQTAQTYLPEIQKNMQDLKVKIILGAQPISAWDSFVDKLKNDEHMKQIIKEMNEAYKARTSNK